LKKPSNRNCDAKSNDVRALTHAFSRSSRAEASDFFRIDIKQLREMAKRRYYRWRKEPAGLRAKKPHDGPAIA
jgi:hypothetical protein